MEGSKYKHIYLTIRQWTQVCYEKIVNKAQLSWLSLMDNVRKFSKCLV